MVTFLSVFVFVPNLTCVFVCVFVPLRKEHKDARTSWSVPWTEPSSWEEEHHHYHHHHQQQQLVFGWKVVLVRESEGDKDKEKDKEVCPSASTEAGASAGHSKDK